MSIKASFDFDASDWDNILQDIYDKWKSVANRKEFGNIIAPHIQKDFQDHFDKERGPQKKWQKWSAAYAKHMRAVGKGNNLILTDSGRLRNSLMKNAGWRADTGGIMFYSKVIYAGVHNQGSKKQNIPQRQFMWLSTKGLDTVIDVIERWLADIEGKLT